MATPTPVIVESASIDQTSAHVDWQAILAGAVAAAGLSAIFITFGGAIGLSMSSARPYAGWSATVIAVVAGLWMALSQVGSFAAGGYVAGRLRHRTGVSRSETSFRDGAHGFIVWCVGTLVGAYLLASGAPEANGVCERFMGSLRRECMDHILIHDDKHLRQVVTEYAAYFNQERPHQGIEQQIPDQYELPRSKPTSGRITSKAILGGLHHSYSRTMYLN